MKNTERKIISELMKNSRRSDRELAKAVGVSQPTVSRLIKKLEKEGYIREYTIIPEFEKLGYTLAALILVKIAETLKPEELNGARKRALKDLPAAPTEIVLFERGMGGGYNGVIVSFHKDYSSYVQLMDRIQQYDFLDHSATMGFLINLEDKVHYVPLTFKALAENLLNLGK